MNYIALIPFSKPSPDYKSQFPLAYSYTTNTPTNTIKSPTNAMVGSVLNAALVVAVAVGLIELLVAVVPLAGLVELGIGTVAGGVPNLLKLLQTDCGMLTGPGPVIIVLKMLSGNEGLGMTEVSVSVCGGLRNVSVTTVVWPFVGLENVLPVFVPLNVPVDVPG